MLLFAKNLTPFYTYIYYLADLPGEATVFPGRQTKNSAGRPQGSAGVFARYSKKVPQGPAQGLGLVHVGLVPRPLQKEQLGVGDLLLHLEGGRPVGPVFLPAGHQYGAAQLPQPRLEIQRRPWTG